METAGYDTVTDISAVADATPLVHGERFGRYIVLETLGVGGMGHVFSAHDVVLERRVALKVLRRADPEERMRLVREARSLAKLSHPNVVALYDVGELNGHVFLAMELVEGTTLREWLRQPERTLEEILEAFTDAANGLDAAHRVGIVHRDFKPDNVLIGRDGRVRVTDFGLAVRAEEAQTLPSGSNLDASLSQARLTETGVVMGTPAYMPVEQHLGMPSDVRSDQFSFCVALYEALYGTRPFHGNTGRDLCLAIRRAELPPPSSTVPWQVHDVVVRGLSANAEDRFPSMRALLEALRAKPEPRRFGLLQVLVGMVIGAVAMAVAQPMAAAVVPRMVGTSVAASGVGSTLVGVSQHAVQWRVASRRAATAAECEAAFEYDLGARVLCLDGLGGRPTPL